MSHPATCTAGHPLTTTPQLGTFTCHTGCPTVTADDLGHPVVIGRDGSVHRAYQYEVIDASGVVTFHGGFDVYDATASLTTDLPAGTYACTITDRNGAVWHGPLVLDQDAENGVYVIEAPDAPDGVTFEETAAAGFAAEMAALVGGDWLTADDIATYRSLGLTHA